MESSELTGIIVPLVTPFDPNESFDPAAMGRLIRFVLKQGADALMPTALTGEGPLLEFDETLRIWDTVFEENADQVSVVPAVISTTTRRASALARAAEERGARAVRAEAGNKSIRQRKKLSFVFIMIYPLKGLCHF